MRNALDKRTDLRAAKNSLEQSDINIKYYSNQIKPDVNAQVNYGTIAYGGTQLSAIDDPFAPAATPTNDRLASAATGRCSATCSPTPIPNGPSASRSAIRSAPTPRTPTWRA